MLTASCRAGSTPPSAARSRAPSPTAPSFATTRRSTATACWSSNRPSNSSHTFERRELARRPAPKAQVVFTVPDAVVLPRDAAHLRHSLGARVCESLASAEDRVLLASPYWSDEGTDKLWDATTKARELRLAVTLAGAKRDPGAEHDHLAAMLRFGQRLADDGADVTCLEFIPPVPGAIFHAKIVCGTVGYLGSGNMTDSALGIHVEAGVPLGHVDVDQVWWLIGVLQQAGLLRSVG